MSTASGLPPKPPPTIPANQTLYVSNLPDKLQKQDLRRQIYYLFATYGSIIDIVALNTAKMRGQAHVTFKDVTTATRAMRDLQGHEFFGKEIRIQYAKGKSKKLAILDGSITLPKAAEIPAENKPTSLQQSIFNLANPSSAPAPATGLPPKPSSTLKPDTTEVAPKSPQGTKRPREEEDEEAESDDDAMQMSESDEE